MRIKKIMAAMIIAAISVGFASCSDNYSVSYSKISLNNDTELKTILTAKGYTFNESGNLELNDLANNTKSLDLSGTKISEDNLKDLSILPNLTDIDLSENEYTDSFDFAKLPSQITGVDLTGNELYEFPGLVNIVTAENGDETVTILHDLKKLYLPESAKYNCDEIPTFYAKATGVDMKMADANGTLAAYTTLREVPDEILRNYLKELYPAMFTGENINLANRMVKASEVSANLVLNITIENKNIEGAEYIIMNPSYKGAEIRLMATESSSLPYLKIKSNIYKMSFEQIDTHVLDLTEASNLCYVAMENNNTIESLDLTSSTTFGQRGVNGGDFDGSDADAEISIIDCQKLKGIIYPDKAQYLYTLILYNLPLFKAVDLSQFKAMVTLELGNLTSLEKLVYFTPEGFYGFGSEQMMFGIGTDVYAYSNATKNFLDSYHNNLIQYNFPKSTGVTTYKWKHDYK